MIHQLVAHECGHFSHGLKAGSWFWANIFAATIKNDTFNGNPYGDGTLPTNSHGQRLALAEGWAKFIEIKCSLWNYQMANLRINGVSSLYNTNTTNIFMENFNVYDRPTSIRTDTNSWWLQGLFWDLLDTNVDIIAQRRSSNGTFMGNIQDRYSLSIGGNQFNLSPIFNRLTSNVNNADDLRNSLINGHSFLSQTYLNINDLFCSYGYYCEYL